MPSDQDFLGLNEAANLGSPMLPRHVPLSHHGPQIRMAPDRRRRHSSPKLDYTGASDTYINDINNHGEVIELASSRMQASARRRQIEFLDHGRPTAGTATVLEVHFRHETPGRFHELCNWDKGNGCFGKALEMRTDEKNTGFTR